MESGEMLKQLLEKFAGDFAIIEEERKLINEQISRLEEKLRECGERKELATQDRDRVLAMKNRYLNCKLTGSAELPGTAAGRNTSTQAAREVSPKPADSPKVAQISSLSTRRVSKRESEKSEQVRPAAAETVPDLSSVQPSLQSALEALNPLPPPSEPDWSGAGLIDWGGESDSTPAAAGNNDQAANSQSSAAEDNQSPSQDKVAAAGDSEAESDSSSKDPERENDGETVKSINDALRGLFR